MRKALLAAMATAAMVVPTAGNAAATETFTIMGTATPAQPGQGDAGAPCVTGGMTDQNKCQKAVLTRVARCAWVTPETRPQAQSGRTGQLGYVFKINALAIRGADPEDERDNARMDLKVVPPVGTIPVNGWELPDVDVTFYASLGACASDYEGPSNVYVPLGGKGPEQIEDGFVSQGRYTSMGDEIGKILPGGSYLDINTGAPKKTNSYFAIVTVIGASGPAGTKVSMTCRLSGGVCPDGWFVPLTGN